MPLSIPYLETSQGDQKQGHALSVPMGAPPLPPGPHPSMLRANQPQGYQHNPQHFPQQGVQQQMPSFPQPPPTMPQMQPPSHMPLLPHHIARPPQMPPHNMHHNIPSSMPPSSVAMQMPGPVGMQNATNQMVPQMQQGNFMGMNPMQSGPSMGGFSNGMPNMQGPPSTSGPQMYPPTGVFNRLQGGQMPMMPGPNPYQPPNPSGMPQPPLPPGPPPQQNQQ